MEKTFTKPQEMFDFIRGNNIKNYNMMLEDDLETIKLSFDEIPEGKQITIFDILQEVNGGKP